MYEIIEIKNNKKKYINLLLLADEQEDMIERYLYRGTMYVLYNNGVRAVCVVTDEGGGVLEIKNIAVYPNFQRHGYGKYLISFIEQKYKKSFKTIKVGTGDSPITVPFYEACGFAQTYHLKNFFIDNYNHPIIECGKQLVDMIYFEKNL